MNLAQYVGQARGRQSDIARSIGCQPQLVWQWTNLVRPVPLERCIPIERATDGAVTRWDLRPDDWYRIWPELIGAEGAPPVPVPVPNAEATS